MSVSIDTINKFHEMQIETVTRSQDAVLFAVGKLATATQGLRAKSPSVPGSVAGPLEKLTGPVAEFVGNPSEITSYLSRSARDWVEVQHRFQAGVLDAFVAEKAAPTTKVKATAKAA